MSKFDLGNNLSIETTFKWKKNYFNSLLYGDEKVFESWTDVAKFSLVFQEFGNKNLPKNLEISLKDFKFAHVEREGQHYLRIDVKGNTHFLNTFESKVVPAIINRILARCDLLEMNDSTA